MSAGLQLIRAIIEDGARSAVTEIAEGLFHGEQELAAYRYFIQHYRRHGQIPTVDTMLQNGIRLPQRQEPISYYITRCRDRAEYNQLTALQGRLPHLIRAGDTSAAMDAIRAALSGINLASLSSSILDARQGFERVVEQYELDQERTGLRGVTLGYDILNRVTEGAQGGDIIIYAGRPNAGKSYVLLKSAIEAWLDGASVLFASMEMTIDQVCRRMMGMMTGINPDYIRRGEVSSFSENLMHETITLLDGLAPFHFVSGDMRKSTGQIDTLIQQYMPDIIYIDAGYLLTADKGRAKDRREKISDVAETLKEIAMGRNRPIVTSVQLNRAGIQKRKKDGEVEQEPGTENLAESDVLGQIATAVMLIYAPSKETRHMRIINMTKNRDGPLVKFLINFGFSPPNFDFIREIDDDYNPADPEENSTSLEEVWA